MNKMVSPLSLGSRNCSWWIALLVAYSVCRTLAAPQDRITIKVATSFGAGRSDGQPTGRALSEPIIITEPQPGQEFVFISANPSPAARTARLNSQVVQQPFVRIESGGVLDQDGILVAEHVAGHQSDTPIGQFTAPVQQDTQNWAPLSGPPGPVLVEEAVPAKVEEIRQGKAINSASHQEEEVNLIPAESVSSRTVIKKAPNGQDYEYEYLYYDVEDVAAQNDTIVNTIASEPTLFSNNDQESLAVVAQVDKNAAAAVQVSEEKQESLTTTTEGVTDTLNQDDLVPVQEIPQVSKVAFVVGDLSDPPAVTDQTINPQDEEEIINTVPSTVATTTTEEATTTTTTEASPISKRRRPTKTTTTVAPSGGSSRIRGKNRFSIDSIQVEPIANAVGPSTKAEGSGRRRISKPMTMTKTTSTLESRAGLAQQVRSQAVDLGDGGEEGDLVEISQVQQQQQQQQVMEENNNNQPDGLDFSRQVQTIERFPINSRFPPRLQENQEPQENDFIQFQDVQERTPLRVVESSSFRNPGNNNPAGGDQVSVGRLTVISGPARLPPPLVAQQDSDILQEEQEPNVFQVRPTLTLDGVPAEETTESGLQVAFDQEIDSQGAIIQTIQPETVVNLDQINGNQPQVEEEEIPFQKNPKEDNNNNNNNNNVSIINRPELIDLLAFSAAAEQQQQDDHLPAVDPIQQAEVEEVLIEEITTMATPLATTLVPQQQQQPVILVADAIQAEDDGAGLVQMDDKEMVGLEEELAVTTLQPVQQQLEEIVPVEQSQAEIGQQPELLQVAVKEELKTTENPLEDVTLQQQQQQVLDVKDFASDVEQVSSESPTTTATTTTTTTTTTTATPTTIEMTTGAAPTTTTTGSRIRGPSRFSGSSNSNANRFNNRIRNRNRGDAPNSSGPTPTTTTSTTTAPVRKNTFRPAGSPFNRLRRPFTTESPKLLSSSEAADSPSSTDVIDTLEMNKESSSSAPSTTRRPLPPNIRNRFSARRNQTGNEIKSSIDEPRPTLSRPKPVSGTGQQQSNRISPPRPMSPLLNRRRFSTTTTTTTTTESGLEGETNNSTSSAEIIGSAVKDEMEANVTGGVEGVVAVVEPDTESTTTTTARPAGLNRLRTRVPLSVSERPKTIRTQVSLNDRRNRFSALANNRKSAEAEENKEEAAVDSGIKLSTSEVVQQQQQQQPEELVVDDSLDNLDGSNVDEVVAVLTTTAPSVKSRRPSRIPGQLAARRNLSS